MRPACIGCALPAARRKPAAGGDFAMIRNIPVPARRFDAPHAFCG